MRRLAIALAVLIGLAAPAWGQDFAKGMLAYGQRDYATAAKWFRLAGEQGLPAAQLVLGHMYSQGQGVPQDHAEAVKWYRKAAVQGLDAAQRSLSLSYLVGKGVPKDFVQAHMWCNLAASNDPPGRLRDQAVKNCDIFNKRMTPDQISEAQRLAREWKPKKHGK